MHSDQAGLISITKAELVRRLSALDRFRAERSDRCLRHGPRGAQPDEQPWPPRYQDFASGQRKRFRGLPLHFEKSPRSCQGYGTYSRTLGVSSTDV